VEALAGIRAGDARAFEGLFRAHHRDLVRFAASLAADAADPGAAEELVQDVFLDVWRRRADWQPGPSVRGYLFAAVRHAVVSRARRRAVAARHVATVRALFARPVADPAALAVSADRQAAVRAAVDRLPPRCRAVFRLVREQELSYAEAAQALGIAVKTVDAQMGRALHALRRHLGTHAPPGP
jgi:RNA polymerase sigma-70 factor (ECF subfamily)